MLTKLLDFDASSAGSGDGKARFRSLRDDNGNLFIDRNGDLFAVVLEFLRTGAVPAELPPGLCEQALSTEFQYYMINQPGPAQAAPPSEPSRTMGAVALRASLEMHKERQLQRRKDEQRLAELWVEEHWPCLFAWLNELALEGLTGTRMPLQTPIMDGGRERTRNAVRDMLDRYGSIARSNPAAVAAVIQARYELVCTASADREFLSIKWA